MNTQATGVQLAAIFGPGLMALYQLGRFLWRRERAHGIHAGLCLLLALDGILRWDVFAVSAPEGNLLQTLIRTLTVPLIMLHVEPLHPRSWLRSLTTFSWAYVIPYGIILGVYPPEQLEPIIPAMWTFSGLSLGGTLLTLLLAVWEKQSGALLLLLAVGLWPLGLVYEPLAAPSLLLLALVGAWRLSRLSDKA